MIYGELGLRPIQIDICERALTFFARTKFNMSLANIMQHVLITNNITETFHSRYLNYINQSLDSLGLGFMHTTTIVNYMSRDQTVNLIKERINDQYLQAREADLTLSNKYLFFRTINNNFSIPPYLDVLPFKLRITLTKFRLSNHKLPIERGRWNNTEIADRVCPFCISPVLGDEHHFLFVCPKFITSRIKFVEKKYYIRPNTYKTNKLFNTNDYKTLVNLSKFVHEISNAFM